MRIELDDAALEALRTSPEVEQGLERVLQSAEVHAHFRVPKDTGELDRSIGHDTEPGRGVLSAGTDHSVYVETGTRYMEAQPYLWPSLVEAGVELR
jgi:hypothetical protein